MCLIFNDAGASRRGDRLQSGSSGFESHRRLFQASGWSRRARGAPALSRDCWWGVFRAGNRNRGGAGSW